MDVGDAKADEGKSNEVEPNDSEEQHYRRDRPSVDLPASPYSSIDTLDRLLEGLEKNDIEAKEQESDPVPLPAEKEAPVTWSSLPRKDQLAMLVLARLSEPLTLTSLRSYMYFQLKSFDPSLPDSTLSFQAGCLASAFTFAQFFTAVWWGRASDSEWFGRKRVLLVGLLGTGISAVGFGFSTNFPMALTFRCLGGAMNGNSGVMRTMVTETIKEKKYQSRAFMLMPMTANIGTIIGPILGGYLSDPIGSYPHVFGPGSIIGGKDGVWWMKKWPYALPNVVSAVFLITSALIVILGLEETHAILRDQPDWGLRLGRFIKRTILWRSRSQYSAISTNDNPDNGPNDIELSSANRSKKQKSQTHRKLPFRRIFTRNVLITLFSRGLLAMHIGTFGNLWYVFLSADRVPNAHRDSFLRFNGGLALPPPKIGLLLSVLGAIGVILQLGLYPCLSLKWGTVPTYRGSLMLFPLAYLLVPFLAILPSSSKPPEPAAGVIIWMGMVFFLFIHVLARTFAMPSAAILVNNCCPHPSVLSTIHGIAQSVTSGFYMTGPILGGWGFGLGLKAGVIGAPFWVLMLFSLAGGLFGWLVKDGDGHEIVLEGEEKEEADGEVRRGGT